MCIFQRKQQLVTIIFESNLNMHINDTFLQLGCRVKQTCVVTVDRVLTSVNSPKLTTIVVNLL